MEEIKRIDVITDTLNDAFRGDFPGVERPEVLGPYANEYDVQAHAVDPSQPTIVLYSFHMIQGAEYLSLAAARMRHRGEPAANFVVVQEGAHSERFTALNGSTRLTVDAGYTYNRKGTAYIFDQPSRPLPITMADSSISGNYINPTMRHLAEAEIPLLRPIEYFAYDDKALVKQRLDQFGIRTPASNIVLLEDLAKRTNDELPERFVIKPRRGMLGNHVTLFSEGLDQARLDEAVGKMRGRYSDVLVEEFVESMPLKHSKVEGPASFNIRSIIFNEHCGSFARVHSKGDLGNVYKGASRMSLPKLKQALYRQQGLDPEVLQTSIETCAAQIGEAFPNCMIGADLMIDTDGNPQVIELNIGDFGAFNPASFSQKDWMQALENTVRNITKVAQTHVAEPVQNEEDGIAYSVVDFSENSTLRLRSFYDQDTYYDANDEFNAKKFKRRNYAFMKLALSSIEDRISLGDVQHSVHGLSVVEVFSRMCGAKRLHAKVQAAVARTAIDEA